MKASAGSRPVAGAPPQRLNVTATLGFGDGEHEVADERDLRLLGQVREQGSITAAAKAVGVTYKTAWDRLRNLQARLGTPLIVAAKGGRGGGRTQLSEHGAALLARYERLRRAQSMAVDRYIEVDPLAASQSPVAEAALPPIGKTSARNQLRGIVVKIARAGMRDRVLVQLHDALTMQVNITHASTLSLGLRKGVAVYLLIKAPAIRLATPEPGVNSYEGVVSGLRSQHGQRELDIQIAPELRLIAAAPRELAQEALKKGATVWISVDPDTIILGID